MGPSEDAEAILTDALATAVALGDLDVQARALSILGSVHWYRGEHARAQAEEERFREIARQIGDTHVLALPDRRIGIRLGTLGRLGDAQRLLERSLQSPLSPTARPLWRIAGSSATARAGLARVLWLQGFAEKAHHQAQRARDEAKGSPDRLAICVVLYYSVGRIAPMTGDFAAAEDATTQMIELSTSLNAPFSVAAGQFLRGKLLVERGEFEDGLTQLRETLGVCEKTGWRLSYPELMGSLASAYAGLGQLDAALDTVSMALASAGGREDGQVWYVPELLRIKGEILLRQCADQPGLAEDCLDQAATMAREQGALTWELRIALSLARLRVAQNRYGQARYILAPVYDRFTEGFAVPDLRAAKAFLDELPG